MAGKTKHNQSSATELDYPSGLYVNNDGTLLISDATNNVVLEWEFNAWFGRTVAGGHGKGEALNQLNYPEDLIVDDMTNSIIICDRGNSRVVRWPRRNGTQGVIVIRNVSCIGLTMDNERSLYVSDGSRASVRKYAVGDTRGRVVAGNNGLGYGLDKLEFPNFIFVDNEHSVYISDQVNHRVVKWIEGAEAGIMVASCPDGDDSYTAPDCFAGLWVDSFGTLYVVNYRYHRVMRWIKGEKEGSVIAGGTSIGDDANQLKNPVGIAFDKHGNLYVLDAGNKRVQQFLIEQH